MGRKAIYAAEAQAFAVKLQSAEEFSVRKAKRAPGTLPDVDAASNPVTEKEYKE